MDKAPKPDKPIDLSTINMLLKEIITYWKEVARMNFAKAYPSSDPDEFEQLWPRTLTNFFLVETIRIAMALRSLSKDRNN